MRTFHLSEPRHGWIDVTFGMPPETFTMTVSDVPNDCLRDLAAALARLLKWGSPEVVQFSLEPEFAICALRRLEDSAHIVIRMPGCSEPAFETMVPLRDFARRVQFELLRIQPVYSAAEGWTQPFPKHEVANLA